MHAEVPHWDDRAQSWELVTLILTGIWMGWLNGRLGLKERFREARETVAKMRNKRRAPGTTLNGYLQALERLPHRAIRKLVAALRDRITELVCAGRVGHWVAFGVDGSRFILPRTEKLEEAFGDKEAEAPNLWLTAIWNLGTGIVWDWRIGPGHASERAHLLQMLGDLSKGSLLVGDIGFGGFEQLWEYKRRGQHFLIRVCSITRLLQEESVEVCGEGARVWLWPKNQRQETPLELRVIRIKEPGKVSEVWLLTDVMNPQELSRAEAQEIYAARWGLEVEVFRALKQTLGKTKLTGRTPIAVYRELELAMVGFMLSQALGVWAIGARNKPVYSIAGIRDTLREYGARIRKGYRGWDFARRLKGALRDTYVRQGSKQARRPIKIKDVKPPSPPEILVMDDKLKVKLYKKLAESMRTAA